MAINLGNMSNTGNTPILNLQKNDILDLTKRSPGLEKVTLGAGWDIASNGGSFDVDIAAFFLDTNGKFNTTSNIFFFNNPQGRGIELSKDNRTGVGEGDDETIKLDLNAIDQSIQKITFVVTIHEGEQKRQTFGMINNSYVRLINTVTNEVLCKFSLKDDSSTATSVIFAELYKEGNGWHFKAVGEGKRADLNGIASLYL